nr:unnamed protein product [Digitaria exilis]
MPVNDEIICTSTNVASQTCKKVVNKDIEKIPEATPAPPPVEKEVTKKTYASILDLFCFGFVEFETEQSMQAAIKQLK